MGTFLKVQNGKSHNYDIVIGAMADDQVYNYITDLMTWQITRGAFWELAKFKHPTHQMTFCAEKALETIKFVNAVRLKDNKMIGEPQR